MDCFIAYTPQCKFNQLIIDNQLLFMLIAVFYISNKKIIEKIIVNKMSDVIIKRFLSWGE